MKRNILKIILVFVALISFTISQSYSMEAGEDRGPKTDKGSLLDILTSADVFIANGELNQENTINSQELSEGMSLMYNIFIGVGVFIASVVGIILGIKFMSAASSDEKAQYKKSIVVYVVGCIIIFGAFGIWKIVVDVLNGVS